MIFIPGARSKYKAPAEGSAISESGKARACTLAAALEGTTQPFSIGAPDGSIMYFNEAFCRLTGYTREELARMNWHTDLTPPEWHESEKRMLGELWRTGNPQRFEKEYIRKDDTRVPIEMQVHQALDDEGKLLFYYKFINEITEHKLTEEALLDAKAQAELYIDLMGHDINNMNQIAMGYLELALDLMDMEGRIDSDNRNLLARPYETLKDSSRLISNVRKIQRQKSGIYKPELIDIDRMLNEVKSQLTSVQGRKIVINYEPGNRCVVRANELLKDVFLNLTGNAIKHSRGPLTVNIRATNVYDEGAEYCKISIEDDGPGITDDMKAKLFDRLNLVNTRARGKGFGLCLIKMLVDDYDGLFWVEDRVPGDYSKGCRFVVQLPTL